MSLSVSNKTLLLLPVLWLVGCTDPAPKPRWNRRQCRRRLTFRLCRT